MNNLFTLIILFNLLYCTVAIDIRNVDTNTGILQIYINNDVPIGGFEFNLIGANIDSVFGGSSELAEYTILTNGNKIMGYSAIGDSIPQGESILCNIKMNEMGYLICFDEFATITDPLGYEIEAVWGECADCSESIQFDNCGMCNGDNSICSGCIYETACNYNEAAIVDDGSCVFVDGVCETCVDGVIVDNDADDDTVCDDMEIIGCQDDSACNYDVTATDSGDCIHTDGICETCEYSEVIDNDADDDTVCDDMDVCEDYDDTVDSDGDGTPDGCDLSIYEGIIPDNYRIASIYPNPFNPVTSITYGLPENTAVQITVYDLGGIQIETLVRSFRIAGYHTIKWDASSYPSGVYLISIENDVYQQTKKAVLLK